MFLSFHRNRLSPPGPGLELRKCKLPCVGNHACPECSGAPGGGRTHAHTHTCLHVGHTQGTQVPCTRTHARRPISWEPQLESKTDKWGMGPEAGKGEWVQREKEGNEVWKNKVSRKKRWREQGERALAKFKISSSWGHWLEGGSEPLGFLLDKTDGKKPERAATRMSPTALWEQACHFLKVIFVLMSSAHWLSPQVQIWHIASLDRGGILTGNHSKCLGSDFWPSKSPADSW